MNNIHAKITFNNNDLFSELDGNYEMLIHPGEKS